HAIRNVPGRVYALPVVVVLHLPADRLARLLETAATAIADAASISRLARRRDAREFRLCRAQSEPRRDVFRVSLRTAIDDGSIRAAAGRTGSRKALDRDRRRARRRAADSETVRSCIGLDRRAARGGVGHALLCAERLDRAHAR